MKILINKYIKRDGDGIFNSAKVLFTSLPTNDEYVRIGDKGLIVNLSKSGNPECDTNIVSLQTHNGHAGTFVSNALMDEYVRRVSHDLTEQVDNYNMELEETQSTETRLEHVTTMHNDDLAPDSLPDEPKFVVANMEMLAQMMEYMADNIETIYYEDEEEEE
jgi:hypothetical protein